MFECYIHTYIHTYIYLLYHMHHKHSYKHTCRNFNFPTQSRESQRVSDTTSSNDFVESLEVTVMSRILIYSHVHSHTLISHNVIIYSYTLSGWCKHCSELPRTCHVCIYICMSMYVCMYVWVDSRIYVCMCVGKMVMMASIDLWIH